MQKNKKVAILTRTTTLNFGTLLQSYALQMYIKSIGFEVFVIDDNMPRRFYTSNKNALNETSGKNTIKEYLALKYDEYKYNKQYRNTCLIEKKIKKFKRKYVSYFNIIELNDLNEKFDIFVSGSDQIWADTAEPELFPFFMQDFVEDNKLKISYAVSVGIKKYNLHNENIVKELLRGFDFLSVREHSSQNALSQYTNKKITIACDPVLLLEPLNWKKLSGRKKLRGRYIFCYFLSNNKWYYDKLSVINKALNVTVYIFQKDGLTEGQDGHIRINSCSPTDFLNYICNAEFVVTDSYHATLFSIIFKRPFNVFERFKNSSDNMQNGRIQYILDKLGLMQYYISQESEIVMNEYSYEKINKKIEIFTKESIDFLQNALEGRK